MSNTKSSFSEIDNISQIIRNRQTVNPLTIASEVRKDIKQALILDNKNQFDFYDAKTNVAAPRRILPKHIPQTYKSIHHIVDKSTKQTLEAKFQVPKYNKLQSEALQEIRNGEYKVNLLSDLYHQFSKEDPKPKYKFKKPQNVLEKEHETKEVEELDKWSNTKLQDNKLKHHMEVEDLKNEVMRMMTFIEDEYLTPNDKKVIDSLFEGFLASQTREDTETDFYESPDYKQMINGEKTLLSLPSLSTLRSSRSLHHTPKKANQGQKNKALTNLKGGAHFHGDSSLYEKMDLKARLRSYKRMHEKIEEKLNEHIQGIEQEIEKREKGIVELEQQNEALTQQIRSDIDQLDGYKTTRTFENGVVKKFNPKKERVSFLPGLVQTAEMQKRAVAQRDLLKALKLDVVSCQERREENEREIKKADIELEFLLKKLNFFEKIKTKLFMKILKHGLDCRNEGLVWVLKDLLKAGENITFDDFPAFLDNKSMAHLLQKGKNINQLWQLKAQEKALITNYKESSEQKQPPTTFHSINTLNKFENTGQSLNVIGSYNSLGSTMERKTKTINDISLNQTRQKTVGSRKSLNEIDFEYEEESSHNVSLEIEGEDNKKNAKAATVICVMERKDEEEDDMPLVATVDKQVNQKSLGKVMSMNDLCFAKNTNENVYHQAKYIISRMLRDQHLYAKGRYLKPANGQVSQSLKSLDTKDFNRKKTLDQVHNLQAKISALIQKIHENDLREGERIIGDFKIKKFDIDLEFYLACVIGLPLAEKLFYKYSLKVVPNESK